MTLKYVRKKSYELKSKIELSFFGNLFVGYCSESPMSKIATVPTTGGFGWGGCNATSYCSVLKSASPADKKIRKGSGDGAVSTEVLKRAITAVAMLSFMVLNDGRDGIRSRASGRLSQICGSNRMFASLGVCIELDDHAQRTPGSRS